MAHDWRNDDTPRRRPMDPTARMRPMDGTARRRPMDRTTRRAIDKSKPVKETCMKIPVVPLEFRLDPSI